MANKTITQLDTAQSLNDNMVIAVQDTNTTYKTTLADVKAYCGGRDAYKVGDRVKDDSNNDVGMVSGFFTDANDQKYAVVCLNAVDRLLEGYYLGSSDNVNDIPNYTNLAVWSAPETATTNTTAILATGTSSACTHCRSKAYTIGGVAYSGQLPNIAELVDIFRMRIKINADDPTASSYPTLIIPDGSAGGATGNWLSSTQQNSYNMWRTTLDGNIQSGTKTQRNFRVAPVLEIPLED